MGTRFRKSIKLGGGARINLSKSGVGFSAGIKGARLTKTARGTTRTTLSIPGSGLSYVSETGKGGAAARKPEAADGAPLDRLEGLDEYFQPELAADELPSAPEPELPQDPKEDKPSAAKKAANIVGKSLRIAFGSFFLLAAVLIGNSIISFLGFLLLAAIILPISAIDRILPIKGWKKWILTVILAIAVVGSWNGNQTQEEPVRAIPAAEETSEATTEPETEPETVPEAEPETEPETEPATIPTMLAEIVTETVPMREYVLNTSSLKIHSPKCSSVKDIAPNNREDVKADIADLKAQGYSPCGRCDPH